jgi:hypothetical protein
LIDGRAVKEVFVPMRGWIIDEPLASVYPDTKTSTMAVDECTNER